MCCSLLAKDSASLHYSVTLAVTVLASFTLPLCVDVHALYGT